MVQLKNSSSVQYYIHIDVLIPVTSRWATLLSCAQRRHEIGSLKPLGLPHHGTHVSVLSTASLNSYDSKVCWTPGITQNMHTVQ